MKSISENLFEDYQKMHQSKLDLKEFKLMLRLIPSLLVCMSDGKLDPEELQGLAQNTSALLTMEENISNQYQEEASIRIISALVDLSDQLEMWKSKLIQSVKYEVMLDPDIKEYIFESMYLFANIHEGICIEEQLAIDELVNELHLQD